MGSQTLGPDSSDLHSSGVIGEYPIRKDNTRSGRSLMATAHDDPLPRLLTIPELAEHLGVTDRHIRRLISERRIPYVKWRRYIRFDPNEIAIWLQTARHPQDNDGGQRR